MSNPLLNAEEQAHIEALRSNGTDSMVSSMAAGQPSNAWELLKQKLAQADYHRAFIRTVHGLVLVSFAFAGFKLAAVYGEYPGLAFLPFLDMHPLLMLFSGLFTVNYIQHRETEGMAMIALLSTGLNALLV